MAPVTVDASLDASSRASLEARGLSAAEAEKQLVILQQQQAFANVHRPCGTGDGVRTLPSPEHDSLLAIQREAAESGRVSLFAPLTNLLDEFSPSWSDSMVEISRWIQSKDGVAQLHFAGSERAVKSAASHIEERAARLPHGVKLRTSTPSLPDASLALEADGSLALDTAGAPLLLPAGDGMFIGDLQTGGGDVIVVNPHGATGSAIHPRWPQLLAGLAVRVHDRALGIVRRLRRNPEDRLLIDRGLRFITQGLGCPIPSLLQNGDDARDTTELLIHYLDRPLRVCGVAPSVGDRLDRPYWRASANDIYRPQLVEDSRIDLTQRHQRACLERSSHASIGLSVCSIRNGDGELYPLASWIEVEAATQASVQQDGRKLRYARQPGLHTGAMAGWTTIFVNVPTDGTIPG